MFILITQCYTLKQILSTKIGWVSTFSLPLQVLSAQMKLAGGYILDEMITDSLMGQLNEYYKIL